VSCYRRRMKKFSKMKVHWRTYNHCLFVAYLASVAIGYGWISDTKFQKFSVKDWIWICKNLFGYGSGVKKSISTHLCLKFRPEFLKLFTPADWCQAKCLTSAKFLTYYCLGYKLFYDASRTASHRDLSWRPFSSASISLTCQPPSSESMHMLTI